MNPQPPGPMDPRSKFGTKTLRKVGHMNHGSPSQASVQKSSLQFALFAANEVGKEIGKVFGASQGSLACLVLDSKNEDRLKREIAACSRIEDSTRIFYSDALYEQETLARLKQTAPDLLLLAWWPYIIKKEILEIPRIGCLNLHPSYLPYNRGKNYNFWTIVEEVPFGVTIHWVNEGIDSGDIAFQSPVEKSWEDTGETLYRKAQAEIVRLFTEKFPAMQRGEIPRTPQDPSQGSFHKSSELTAASRIDLDQRYTARHLLNILRARTFPSHPGAWFMDGNEKYEVRVAISKVTDAGKTQ